MTYHPLTSESGGTEADRCDEAHTICGLLEEFWEEMSEKEKAFLTQMTDCDYCTTKQLFYLRDIKDRYI